MKKILFMAYAAAIALTFSSCAFAPMSPNADGFVGGMMGEPVENTSGDQF